MFESFFFWDCATWSMYLKPWAWRCVDVQKRIIHLFWMCVQDVTNYIHQPAQYKDVMRWMRGIYEKLTIKFRAPSLGYQCSDNWAITIRQIPSSCRHECLSHHTPSSNSVRVFKNWLRSTRNTSFWKEKVMLSGTLQELKLTKTAKLVTPNLLP